MNIIGTIFDTMNASKSLVIKKNEEIKKGPSLIKLLMGHPEKFKLEAFIEGEEIVIKVRKRE